MIVIQPAMRRTCTRLGSRRDLLIDPLRQPSLSRSQKERGGLSKKISKFRYSARARPAATRRWDRCGRRETCCNEICDEPEFHAEPLNTESRRNLVLVSAALFFQRLCVKFWFIADWVAAGLPPARTDPIDEWLHAALALSIEIFLERPLAPSAIAKDPAV